MKQLIYLIAGIAIGAMLATFALSASSANSIQDPVKQSPQYYKVLLENDQVRVAEYRLKPGEKEPMHSHTSGVLYIFADAKMKTTFPDGRVEENSAGGGEAHWRNPVTHALENTGRTDAHALAIDIKNTCKQ